MKKGSYIIARLIKSMRLGAYGWQVNETSSIKGVVENFKLKDKLAYNFWGRSRVIGSEPELVKINGEWYNTNREVGSIIIDNIINE